MYDLIIAEKNTLAEDIAKAFRKYSRKKNFITAEDPELGKAKIFWTFGHILEVNVEKSLESAGFPKDFPVFPERLKLTPKRGRKELFKALADEIKSGKYRRIIHAGDPDREGELLIREVLNYLKVPKNKVFRIWFNSQTRNELRRALKNALPCSNYDHVYFAGAVRQKADFYLGINGSIALHRKTGNRNLSLGRVQTPVLRLIVERDAEIENFQPQEYYVISIECEKDGKRFKAVFTRPTRSQSGGKKEKNKRELEEDKEREADIQNRLSKEEAEKIYRVLQRERNATVARVNKKLNKQLPPKLPSLSDIQKEAGKYKFTAQKVLSTMQVLYEKYKCISYPRSSARFLSRNDVETVKESLTKLGLSKFIPNIPDRIFNDKEVEKAGHHAVIPIDRLPETASKDEKIIYDIIMKRFVSQFYPPYEYETTTVVLKCAGYPFKVSGKVDRNLGWKQLFKQEKKEESNIPPLKEGETVIKRGESVEKRFTKPPVPFTSARLITVMEKLGLGTEATRAQIEEALIKRGYVERDKRGVLSSTEKGKALIRMLKGLKFTVPEYTAEWEKVLNSIMTEKNLKVIPSFIESVRKLTRTTVSEIEAIKDIDSLKRKPSPKMVAYAKKLVQEKGLDVSMERLSSDFSYCAKIIEENKPGLTPPSEKQVTLARNLSSQYGEPLSEEVLQSSRQLSKWITKVLEKHTKRKKRKKGRRKKLGSGR